ncbi:MULTISPECIES: hypothetical protein [Cysteiniphilum]|uniref:Uncharacterized protein n=1 Tax=Cysteiniphilum litorale TaxID=2056700 RepID=A0A8J3E9E6_9GAMM|nr:MULTISPECIES: hypothetical protein [Cysteiniphilum]GGG07102.1 hypothetical protein GCM10010995_25750 [Cysteiniphilum litorale]
MTVEKLMPIAVALSHMARIYVPTSSNLNLDAGNSDYQFTKAFTDIKTSVYEDDYLGIMSVGYGTCGYLSTMMRLIATHIKKPDELVEKTYLTHILLNSHVYCLLHSSQSLHEFVSNLRGTTNCKACAASFCEMASKSNFSDAIIVDPWVYKVTPLKDWLKHIEYAVKFGGNIPHMYSKKNSLGKEVGCVQRVIGDVGGFLPKSVIIGEHYDKVNYKKIEPKMQKLFDKLVGAYKQSKLNMKFNNQYGQYDNHLKGLGKDNANILRTNFYNEFKKISKICDLLQEIVAQLKVRSRHNRYVTSTRFNNSKHEAYYIIENHLQLIQKAPENFWPGLIKVLSAEVKDIVKTMLSIAFHIRYKNHLKDYKKITLGDLHTTTSGNELIRVLNSNTKYFDIFNFCGFSLDQNSHKITYTEFVQQIIANYQGSVHDFYSNSLYNQYLVKANNLKSSVLGTAYRERTITQKEEAILNLEYGFDI